MQKNSHGAGTSSAILKAAVASVLLASGAAQAQLVEGFLEGPITDVVLDTDPGNGIQGTVKVNGIQATVPDGIQISSPTNANLTLVDIKLGTGGALPGRPTGFENGTCLCATEFDPATGAITITDFVAEPAENVAIASVTEHSCAVADCSDPGDVFRVGGVRVIKNTDPRIESAPPTNAGFEVDLSNGANPAGLAGRIAAVEGYLGTDAASGEPALYYYALDVEGAARVNAGTVEITIERAQCRDRQGGQYKVRGNVSEELGGPVILYELDFSGLGDPIVGNQIGSAVPILDPATGFAQWDISGSGSGSCSNDVRAEYAGALTDGPVDIRN